MLVLTRKKNETIVIDGQITIEVLKIKGNTIRLGISAPSDIKVLRGELSPLEIDVQLDEVTPASQPSTTGKTRSGRSLLDFMNDSEDVSRLPNPFAVATAV